MQPTSAALGGDEADGPEWQKQSRTTTRERRIRDSAHQRAAKQLIKATLAAQTAPSSIRTADSRSAAARHHRRASATKQALASLSIQHEEGTTQQRNSPARGGATPHYASRRSPRTADEAVAQPASATAVSPSPSLARSSSLPRMAVSSPHSATSANELLAQALEEATTTDEDDEEAQWEREAEQERRLQHISKAEERKEAEHDGDDSSANSSPPHTTPHLLSPDSHATRAVPTSERQATPQVDTQHYSPMPIQEQAHTRPPPGAANELTLSDSGSMPPSALIVASTLADAPAGAHNTPYDSELPDDDFPARSTSLSRHSSLSSDVTSSTTSSSRHTASSSSLASLSASKLRQLLTDRLTSLDNAQLRRVIAAVEQMDNSGDTGTDTETEGEWTGADTDKEGDERPAGGEREEMYDDDGEETDRKDGEKDRRRRKKKHHRGGRKKRRDDTHSRDTAPATSASTSNQSSTPTAIPPIPPSSMVHRDWNDEFQALLSTVSDDETVLDNQHSFEQLSELAADFAFTARAIGRIIISEKYLSKDEKTIRPAAMGGIAGGEKYVSHNIVFKFQVDYLNLYGGDANAAAAGDHELVGLSAYYRVISTMRGVGIHVPLACLIDYRGFRLWAVSRLPISRHTLILGSSDGGEHIVNLDPNVSQAMARIALHLNLKPHHVMDKSGKQTLLHGPFDIEGHRGTDGRVYLLDFHRVFPPEPVQASAHLQLKNAHLYRLLRPELVRSNERPLSSDAFVRASDARVDGKREAEDEVVKAYERLVSKVIPRFAEQLDKLGSLEHIDRVSSVHQRSTERWILESALQEQSRPISALEEAAVNSIAVDGEVATEDAAAVSSYRTRVPASPTVSRAPSPAPSPPPSPSMRASSDVQAMDPIAYSPRFISYLHQAGINIRLLGVLRSHVTTPALREVLLVEMLARVLKGDMRRRWREKMASYKYISEGVYRRCSIDFVNLVFCRSAHSTRYWQQHIKRQISEKFHHALMSEESQPHFDLKASLLPMPDERAAGTASAGGGSGNEKEASANSSILPSAIQPIYQLSSSQEKRLTALLRTDSTDASASTSSHATPGASAPSSPRTSIPPLASSTSAAPARRDLLRLVFLRFIHLTGLVVQEGIIPAHQHVYNQPSVPMPAYGGSTGSRWEGRRNSGTWETASAAAAPPLPSHSNSLPLRLNGSNNNAHGRHASYQNLNIAAPTRSQTSQQLASIHRSSSSNGLVSIHPPRTSSHFPFPNSLSSAPSSSQSALPSGSSTVHPTIRTASSTSQLPSPFFLFYERPMEDIHLTSIEEQVKTLNIVSYAEGTALMCKCVSKSRLEDGSTADEEHSALTQYLADLAEAKFKESLRRNVDDCLTLCNYSMLVSLVHKDQEQAKALLLSAIYASSSHHRSYYYLAQLYFYTYRQHRVAEFLYRSALKLNPRHVNSHKDYANLLWYINHDTVRAEQHFRTAVQLQPDHIKAQLGLGTCLAHKAKEWGDWQEVLECYRKAGSSNYGEEATRVKAQRNFLLLLVVKAQLHADRHETEQAVQCFREALTFRPAALLPHQLAAQQQRDAEAGRSTGPVFPPASAFANYALFESRRRRWSQAQRLFLQAIESKTGLAVNYQNNTLLLPATVAGLPLNPQRVLPQSAAPPPPAAFAPSPRSSTFASAVKSPAQRPTASLLILSVGPVPGPATFALPASSVWAVSASSVHPAATPSQAASIAPTVPSALSAALLNTRANARASEHAPTPSTALVHSAAAHKGPSSPQAAAVNSRPAPSSSASSSSVSASIPASSPSTQYSLTSAPPNIVPWSLALSSSPPTAPANVWQKPRKWLPDTNSAPNKQRAMAVDELPDGYVDSDADTDDGELTVLDRTFSTNSQQLQEEALRSSASATSPSGSSSSSASLPSASIPKLTRRERYRSTLSQSELNERAEEDRLEASCVDTAIIRLYVEALLIHQPNDLDAIERWLRYACLLCPYGRNGSLNFAGYADFLYRCRRLQFDAQQCFYRAIAGSTPAPEALYRYASYLMDVVQDKKRSRAMRDRADKVKLLSTSHHLCHRVRAGWYCEGSCELPALKLLISAARVRQGNGEKKWDRSAPYANTAANSRRPPHAPSSYEASQRQPLSQHGTAPNAGHSMVNKTAAPQTAAALTTAANRQTTIPSARAAAAPASRSAQAFTTAASAVPPVVPVHAQATYSGIYSTMPLLPSPSNSSPATSPPAITPPHTPAAALNNAIQTTTTPIIRAPASWCAVAKSGVPQLSAITTGPVSLPSFNASTSPASTTGSPSAVTLPAFKPPSRPLTSPPATAASPSALLQPTVAPLPSPSLANTVGRSSSKFPFPGGTAVSASPRVAPSPFPSPTRR